MDIRGKVKKPLAPYFRACVAMPYQRIYIPDKIWYKILRECKLDHRKARARIVEVVREKYD